MSIRLLQVDQYGIGGQERDDDRQEIDEVAQIDDAAGDRAEMAEQAGAGDGADQALGSPILQQPQYRRGAGDAPARISLPDCSWLHAHPVPCR